MSYDGTWKDLRFEDLKEEKCEHQTPPSIYHLYFSFGHIYAQMTSDDYFFFQGN